MRVTIHRTARRRLRRLALAAGCAGATVALLWACVDLESLGNGVRPSEAGAEAAFDAVPAEVRFCSSIADATLFCDDFDDEGDAAPGARWLGIEGLVQGVLLGGEAGVTLGGTYPPKSPPGSLEMFVDREPTDTKRGLAFLTQVVPVPQRAVEVTADVRLVELLDKTDAGGPTDGGAKDAGPKDAGPTDAGPTDLLIPILGVGTIAATTIGASVWMGDDKLTVFSGVQGNRDVAAASTTPIAFRYLSVMRTTWVTIHLVAGDREAVAARLSAATGVGAICPSTRAAAGAWSSVPLGQAVCIALPDTLVPLSERLVGAVVGTTMPDPARARLQFDNVHVDGVP